MAPAMASIKSMPLYGNTISRTGWRSKTDNGATTRSDHSGQDGVKILRLLSLKIYSAIPKKWCKLCAIQVLYQAGCNVVCLR